MPELLTQQDALRRHREQVLAAIREPQLQGLIWEATLACNLACGHCGNPVEGKEGDGPWKHAQELDTHEIKRIFSEIAQDFDARGISVGITGGEPTLRADLCDVVRHARSLGFSVSLTTNCVLTGKDLALADRLVEAGVQLFTISLDGLQEGHDAQRGVPGSFDLVVRTIRHLREKHPSVGVTINTIATPYNWREIPGVYRLVAELGVPLWNLGPVSPVGRAADPLTHLSDEQLRDLAEWIQEKNKPANVEATGVRIAWVCDGWVGSAFEGRVREGMFFCGAGTRIASVLYDGKAATCLEVRRDLGVQGDLRRERMKDVWERKYGWFRGDREKFRKGPCATCAEWDWCQGSSLHLREADGELIECVYHRISKAKPRDATLPTVIETVEIAPLTIVQRDGTWIVGNDDTGTFAEMPPIGVLALRTLQGEPDVAKARETMRQRHGRDVDLAAFARAVAAGGFVAKVNGQALDGANVPVKRRKLFEKVDPAKLAFFRSPAYWWLAIVPFVAALAAMLGDPFYRPSYRDFFFVDWYTVVGLTTFLVFGLLVLKHELGHVLMARALGARASLGLSTRLTYLAVQTDATGLWVLGKKDRMKVYAAGMATDAFVIGVGTLLLALGHEGVVPALANPWFVGLTKLAILASVMMWAFQFFFQVRTDIYYIVSHGLECRNLYGDARAWLRKRFDWLVPRWRALPEPNVAAREMKYVRVYGMLHFVGVGVFVLYFVGLVIPALAMLYGAAFRILWGAVVHDAYGWRDVLDACSFIGIHVAYFGAVATVYWRQRRVDSTGLATQAAAAEDEATRRLLSHAAPEGMLRTVGGKLAQLDPERATRRAVVLGPHMKAAAVRARRQEAPPPSGR